MLMPKRVKRRKQFRGSMAGKASRGNTLAYGEFGLVATEPCWIKSNQIEAARIALTRYTKRTGKVWIKIFPDKPVTVKPLGTRMGSGKGSPEYWVAHYKDVANLDGLILNMATRIKTNLGGTSITTVEEALDVLTRTGVINSPDYWASKYTALAWLDVLLISAANALTE